MTTLNDLINQALNEKQTKLLPENIKKGVTAFGVEGTLQEGIDTTDATAIANDIFYPTTAYVNGEKITGTVETVKEEVILNAGEVQTTNLDVPCNESKLYYEFVASSPDGNILIVQRPTVDRYYSTDLTTTVFALQDGVYKVIKEKSRSASSSEYEYSAPSSYVSKKGFFSEYPDCYFISCYTLGDGFLYNIKTGEITENVLYSSHSSYGIQGNENLETIYCIYYNSYQGNYRVNKLYVENNTFKTKQISFDSYYLSIANTYNDKTLTFSTTYQPLFKNNIYSKIGLGFYTDDSGNTQKVYTQALVFINNDVTLTKAYKLQAGDFIIPNPSCTYAIVNNKIKRFSLNQSDLTYSITNLDKTITFDANNTFQLFYWANDEVVAVKNYPTGNIRLYKINFETGTKELILEVPDYPQNHNPEAFMASITNTGACTYNGSTVTVKYLSGGEIQERIVSIQRDGVNYSNISDASAQQSDIKQGETAYVASGKIIGSMPNNGELTYTPTTEEQAIPEGYTSGGKVLAAAITQEEYNTDLDLSNQILGREI